MPAIVAWFGQMFLSIAGSWAMQVLVTLGIGVVSYGGMTTTLDWLKGQVVANASGLPADVLGMMSTMKVGNAISIVLSAMLARQVMSGISGDKVKKWVTK